MKQDRFLLAILVAIGILALGAVGLFLARRDTQEYVTDETPQGVIHNYVLALGKEDFQRAYGYLADEEGKPGYEDFRKTFLTVRANHSGAAVQIVNASQSQDDAVVELVVIRSGGGPFREVYRQPANALLVLNQAGEWRISSMPYPYWVWDWYSKRAEPVEPPPP